MNGWMRFPLHLCTICWYDSKGTGGCVDIDWRLPLSQSLSDRMKGNSGRCHGTYPDAQKYARVQHSFRNNVGTQNTSPVGLEPTTSGLEVRRAIHCATETSGICWYDTWLTIFRKCFRNYKIHMCIGTTKSGIADFFEVLPMCIGTNGGYILNRSTLSRSRRAYQFIGQS